MSEKPQKTITLVCVADTHGLHGELELPWADVLIHAGDYSCLGSHQIAREFDQWLGELRHPLKIVVPGNHDPALIGDSERARPLRNAIVLIDQLHAWKRLRFFGLSSAAHCELPERVDVLITHYPPYGVCDCEASSDLHLGDRDILRAVRQLRPRIHVFGHIHGGYGIQTLGTTTCVNAALLGPWGAPDNRPILLSVSTRS